MQGPEPEPDEVAAAELGAALAGQPVVSLTRFPTGGQHFVYDLTLADRSLAALRLSRRSDRPLAEAALAWNRRLRPLGVPLPAILAEDVAGTRQTFPALLLERLPGTDLGAVIGTLPRPALVAVAERLCAMVDAALVRMQRLLAS